MRYYVEARNVLVLIWWCSKTWVELVSHERLCDTERIYCCQHVEEDHY